MLLLLACVDAESKDTSDTDTAGPRRVHVDETWEVTACGDVRALLHGDGIEVALQALVDVWSAGTAGTPVTVIATLGEEPHTIAVAQEPAYTGEMCGSSEGFGMVSEPYWQAVEGSFAITYTPSQAWPSDDDSWMVDGSAVGTATVDVGEVVFELHDADDTDTLVLSGDPVSADLTMPELPA